MYTFDLKSQYVSGCGYIRDKLQNRL